MSNLAQFFGGSGPAIGECFHGPNQMLDGSPIVTFQGKVFIQLSTQWVLDGATYPDLLAIQGEGYSGPYYGASPGLSGNVVVCGGNGEHILINENGGAFSIKYSTDNGFTWSSGTAPASGGTLNYGGTCNGLVWGGTGTATELYTGTDHTNITKRTITGGPQVYDMAWNGTVWCAVGFSGASYNALTSTDGTTWTGRTGVTNGAQAIAWNGTTFCAFNASNRITYTSTDGITWTATSNAVPSGPSYRSLILAIDGLFWLCSVETSPPTATWWSSPDGITWTKRNVTDEAPTSTATSPTFRHQEGDSVLFLSTNGQLWRARPVGFTMTYGLLTKYAGPAASCKGMGVDSSTGDIVAATTSNSHSLSFESGNVVLQELWSGNAQRPDDTIVPMWMRIK